MSRLIVRTLSLLAFLATFALAQAPTATTYTLYADSVSGTPVKMDFSKRMTGINDPGLLFSHFAGKPLLIYYFSPKCVHCQHHFPDYQKLVKEYESRGLTGIGVALGGYIKKNDIRLFIDQHKVSIPVLQDTDMQFGPTYGTGYVPVAFLVLPDGTFYRYEQIKAEAHNHIRETLNKLLPQAK